MKIGRP